MSAPRPASVAHWALGAALGAGLLAVYPAALARAPRGYDLAVDVRGTAPHRIALAAARGAPGAVITPSGAAGRLEHAGEASRVGPGIAFHTWQVTYGRRWERQVTLPSLAGPFEREGERWGCSMAVRIGPGLFDTTRAGVGIQRIIDQRVRAHFPQSRYGGLLNLPAVRQTTSSFELRDGFIHVQVTVTLQDGAFFRGDLDVEMLEEQGELIVRRRGAVRAEVRAGPTWQRVLMNVPVLGTSVVSPIVRQSLEREVGDRVDEALGALRLPAPWAPFPDRPGDRISVRLAGAPRVAPGGVELTLCPVATLASPRADAGVPGPIAMDFGLPALPATLPPGRGAHVEFVATPAFVNQVLYVMWQTGRLARWGRDRAIVDAMPRQVRDLSFRLEGFDPRLPPAIATRPDGAAWRVSVGDVALGTLDGRTVVGHGDLLTSLGPGDGRGVALAMRIDDLRVNCAAPASADLWRLTPCMSDLMPMVRDRPERPAAGWNVDDVLLQRLAHFEFSGLRIALSGFRAETSGSPARIHMVSTGLTSAR